MPACSLCPSSVTSDLHIPPLHNPQESLCSSEPLKQAGHYGDWLGIETLCLRVLLFLWIRMLPAQNCWHSVLWGAVQGTGLWGSTSGLYPLGVSSTMPLVVTTKDVSGSCPVSSWWAKPSPFSPPRRTVTVDYTVLGTETFLSLLAPFCVMWEVLSDMAGWFHILTDPS